MINLETYLSDLQNYTDMVNSSLNDIIKTSKVNFTYKYIKFDSVSYCGENNIIIKLLIGNYDNSQKDYIMEINFENDRIDTLTYKKSVASSTLMFERARIDRNSLMKIISLTDIYKEYFKNSLSYENIMRRIRQLPDHLPFFNHPLTERDKIILKETYLDNSRLPAFLYGTGKRK